MAARNLGLGDLDHADLVAFLDALPGHLFATTPSGECVYASRSWDDLSGREPTKGRGHDWTDALHGDDREEALARWGESVEHQRPFSHSHRVQSADGPAWMTVDAVPVRSKGRPLGFAGFAHQVPIQLVDIRDLALRGIVHDLRNVLTAVASQVDLARSELDFPSSILGDLEGLVDHAIEVSAELADGRPREGRVDVNELVRSVVAAMGPSLRRNVRTTLRLDPSLPPIVAHRILLWRSVMNLVVNANEAMPGGGELVLESSRGAESGTVRLTVRDSGEGIPEDRLPDLFRVGLSTRGGHGRGLGLALVHAWARMHGGSVSVESELGVGSAFHLEIGCRSARSSNPAASR